MGKGVVKITRSNDSFGVGRKLKIYVDDVHTGDVGWNETADLYLDPGNHRVYVKMDWCRSADQKLEVEDGHTVEFRVTIPSGQWMQWGAMAFKASRFFGLERK